MRQGADTSIRKALVSQARLTMGTQEHSLRYQDLVTEDADLATKYINELKLEAQLEIAGHTIFIEGRLDGFRKEEAKGILEEVKTVILPPEVFSERDLVEDFNQQVQQGLRYAEYKLQLEIYFFLICQSQNERIKELLQLDKIQEQDLTAKLVFRNLTQEDEKFRELSVEILPDLQATEDLIQSRLIEILEPYLKAQRRAQSLKQIRDRFPFPFESYRKGQEALSVKARETLETGSQLLLQAPPGIGKTAAVLFAAISYALPQGMKVFWVTAKTTQQRLVLETLKLFLSQCEKEQIVPDDLEGPFFRARLLRAREKMCPLVQEGKEIFCHDSYCEYAKSYTRKIRESGLDQELSSLALMSAESLYDKAFEAKVCPYELSIDSLEEADFIIGDYNYVFDRSSPLHRDNTFDVLANNSILIIDEAHNLPSRGRGYHSPAIETQLIQDVIEIAEPHAASQDRDLFEVSHHLKEIISQLKPSKEAETVDLDLDPQLFKEIYKSLEPARQRRVIQRKESGGKAQDDPVEQLSKQLKFFTEVLELRTKDVPIAVYLKQERRKEYLKAQCLNPAKALGECLGKFHSTISMSATLEPFEFFGNLLGYNPSRTQIFSSESYFPKENKAVFVVPNIYTTYKKRQTDASKVAGTIDQVALSRPGNYMAFFSSHRYLKEVANQFMPWRIGDDVILQTPRMTEAERDALLESLKEPDSRKIILAVQGGIFGEGVDYPHSMLSGVIVVGPGLPKFGTEEEFIREYFHNLYGKGFEYAYLYPGMHRVIQSAGRLIRTPEDVGVIVLVGQRFSIPPYQKLFPKNWYEETPKELITQNLEEELKTFWNQHSPPERNKSC